MHSGWADPCDCPKCGQLDSVISVSGRLAFALPPDKSLNHCLMCHSVTVMYPFFAIDVLEFSDNFPVSKYLKGKVHNLI